MKIIKQEIQFEKSLKKRLEFICEFSKVSPTFIKASIRKIEKINLSYTTTKYFIFIFSISFSSVLNLEMLKVLSLPDNFHPLVKSRAPSFK